MKCYEVEVRTTNAMKDKTCVPFNSDNIKLNEIKYYDCKRGILYVIADDPKLIYDKFQDAVVSIKEIGFGYYLKNKD